jgi:hypothetical protein
MRARERAALGAERWGRSGDSFDAAQRTPARFLRPQKRQSRSHFGRPAARRRPCRHRTRGEPRRTIYGLAGRGEVGARRHAGRRAPRATPLPAGSVSRAAGARGGHGGARGRHQPQVRARPGGPAARRRLAAAGGAACRGDQRTAPSPAAAARARRARRPRPTRARPPPPIRPRRRQQPGSCSACAARSAWRAATACSTPTTAAPRSWQATPSFSRRPTAARSASSPAAPRPSASPRWRCRRASGCLRSRSARRRCGVWAHEWGAARGPLHAGGEHGAARRCRSTWAAAMQHGPRRWPDPPCARPTACGSPHAPRASSRCTTCRASSAARCCRRLRSAPRSTSACPSAPTASSCSRRWARGAGRLHARHGEPACCTPGGARLHALLGLTAHRGPCDAAAGRRAGMEPAAVRVGARQGGGVGAGDQHAGRTTMQGGHRGHGAGVQRSRLHQQLSIADWCRARSGSRRPLRPPPPPTPPVRAQPCRRQPRDGARPRRAARLQVRAEVAAATDPAPSHGQSCERLHSLGAAPLSLPLNANRVSEAGLKAMPLSNTKRDTMPYTCQVGGLGPGGV